MSYKFYSKLEILKRLTKNQIIILHTINSTNQYIIDNMSFMKSGDVCIAACQTHGRGKQGRIWFSPLYQNVYLSIYWKFYRLKFLITELSLTISIILAEILQNLGLINIRIKWPNDLYFDKRKIAGVLIEKLISINNRNVVHHVVIGVGINLFMDINTVSKNKIGINWISLKQVGINIDQNFLVAIIINLLRQRLTLLDHKGFLPFFKNWRFF